MLSIGSLYGYLALGVLRTLHTKVRRHGQREHLAHVRRDYLPCTESASRACIRSGQLDLATVAKGGVYVSHSARDGTAVIADAEAEQLSAALVAENGAAVVARGGELPDDRDAAEARDVGYRCRGIR